MSTVKFIVAGIPQQRGSKQAFAHPKGGSPIMRDMNAKSKPWMAAVAAAASEAMAGKPLLTGPLAAEVTFWFPRPKGHYGTGRNASTLKESAPIWHDKRPDCDKLMRSMGDAMTGVVYGDDSQLAKLTLRKMYADGSGGVTVEVFEF